jgi:hypothetical protein
MIDFKFDILTIFPALERQDLLASKVAEALVSLPNASEIGKLKSTLRFLIPLLSVRTTVSRWTVRPIALCLKRPARIAHGLPPAWF